MLILGVDPGLERMGWGIIQKVGSQFKPVAYGCWTSPKGELGARLTQLASQMSETIKQYQPEYLATERQMFVQNKTTALDVAKASGVMLYVSSLNGLVTTELAPTQIKQAVTGVGNADKKQVEFMVKKLLGLQETPKPDDVSDALAIAIAFGMLPRQIP